MSKRNILSILIMSVWLATASVAITPYAAFAQVSGSSGTSGSTGSSSSGSSSTTGNTCISSSDFTNATSTGESIINAVFTSINTVMTQVSESFYTGIVGNSNFQDAVGGAILLYLTIYGVMIMFNLTPQQHARDVVGRLIKIGIVYLLLSTSTGWTSFNTYIGNLFLGGMNELIVQFSAAGVGAPAQALVSTSSAAQLDPSAMAMLYDPIGKVFAAKFIAAILALPTMGNYGWMMAICLIFGLAEFIFMLLGALATYVKSIIGLCFLFGIAPIFIAFLLFDRTRQIFIGWVNQIVSFALTPVMLFAFLAFYVQLIDTSVTNMLYGANAENICLAHFFQMGTLDIQVPRFTYNQQLISGDQTGSPPPIKFIDILYFVVLCFLGKSFGRFIEQLAQDLSGGVGPGAVDFGSPTSMLINKLSGGGRGGSSSAGSAASQAKSASRTMATKR